MMKEAFQDTTQASVHRPWRQRRDCHARRACALPALGATHSPANARIIAITSSSKTRSARTSTTDISSSRTRGGEICAVQPFFMLDQDLLAGIGAAESTAAAEFVRRLWPGFMRMRTLMVGCTAGEGHLDRSRRIVAPSRMRSCLPTRSTSTRAMQKASLIVLKEFPGRVPAGAGLLPAITGSRACRACPWFGSISIIADFDDYMKRGI